MLAMAMAMGFRGKEQTYIGELGKLGDARRHPQVLTYLSSEIRTGCAGEYYRVPHCSGGWEKDERKFCKCEELAARGLGGNEIILGGSSSNYVMARVQSARARHGLQTQSPQAPNLKRTSAGQSPMGPTPTIPKFRSLLPTVKTYTPPFFRAAKGLHAPLVREAKWACHD